MLVPKPNLNGKCDHLSLVFVLNASFDNNNNTKKEKKKEKKKNKKKRKNNFLKVPFEDQKPPSCLRCVFFSVQDN